MITGAGLQATLGTPAPVRCMVARQMSAVTRRLVGMLMRAAPLRRTAVSHSVWNAGLDSLIRPHVDSGERAHPPMPAPIREAFDATTMPLRATVDLSLPKPALPRLLQRFHVSGAHRRVSIFDLPLVAAGLLHSSQWVQVNACDPSPLSADARSQRPQLNGTGVTDQTGSFVRHRKGSLVNSSTRGRRRRIRAQRLASTTALVLAVAGLAACSSTPQSSAPAAVAAVNLPTDHRAECLDASPSDGPDTAARALTETAARLPSRLPALSQTGAFPGMRGLDLTVRAVSTRSFSSRENFVRVTIPSVDRQAERPDLSAKGVLDVDGPYAQWKAGRSTLGAQHVAASTALDSGSKQLAAFKPPAQSSAVVACVAALAATTSTPAKFLIVSDLANNEPGRLAAGSLSGTDLIIVQSCPGGDSVSCSRLAAAFTRQADAAGANSVSIVRPELLPEAVDRFMTGDGS